MSLRITAVVGTDDGADLRGARASAESRGVSSVLRASARDTGDVIDRAVADGAQWIWLLGSRDEPAPDALSRLLDVAGSGDAVGLVGPRLRVSDSGRLALRRSDDDRTGPACEPGVPGARSTRVSSVGLRTSTPSTCPERSISAEVIRAVGAPAAALSTSYRGIEYARRVRAAGFRVVLAPHAEVVVPAQTARALLSSPRPPRAVADVRRRASLPTLPRPVRCGLAHEHRAVVHRCSAAASAASCRTIRVAHGTGGAPRVGSSVDRRAVAHLRRISPIAEPAPGLLATRQQLDTAPGGSCVRPAPTAPRRGGCSAAPAGAGTGGRGARRGRR